MYRTLIVLWTITRVVATVLFLGWASLRLRRLDPFTGLVLPEWLKPAGVVLLLTGGTVVLLCGGMLSTPSIVPTEFVVRGVFRYVRNPMSLGAVTMMFGLGLSCRSISILLLSGLLFLFMHIFVVFVEEPGLEKRFGASYVQYKKSVNRWLPKYPRGIAMGGVVP